MVLTSFHFTREICGVFLLTFLSFSLYFLQLFLLLLLGVEGGIFPKAS